jgi:SAM-dependent MidA family methyltransferase
MTLKKHIQDLISDDGEMPFDRFMEVALYHPQGFFGGNRLRSEKAGDFLTSPEVSPLFGETLGRYVQSEHVRIGDPFMLVEVAAGSGSLLRPLLNTYQVPAAAVEASPPARDALTVLLGPERVHTTMAELGEFRGVILANELIDNLPMAIAQRVDGSWRERWVGANGEELLFVDAEPRPEVLRWLDQFASGVPDGGWVEVQLQAEEWLRQAIDQIEAGSILLIDYGDTSEGLLPRRSDGTLRTYRAHHLGPHPLEEPGETDITGDVNFTALIATAEERGATTRLSRQDDFLTELGLRDRLSEIRHAELAATRSGDEIERLKIRSRRTEVETLLHPRGLGDFRVLTISF